MPGLRSLAPAKLTWYARRLQSMGPREVADRALTVGATAARRVTGDREPDDATLLGRADPDWAALLGDFRAGTGRPVLLDRDTATAVAAAHPEAVKELLAAADRVLEHRFTFFAHPEAHYPARSTGRTTRSRACTGPTCRRTRSTTAPGTATPSGSGSSTGSSTSPGSPRPGS